MHVCENERCVCESVQERGRVRADGVCELMGALHRCHASRRGCCRQ